MGVGGEVVEDIEAEEAFKGEVEIPKVEIGFVRIRHVEI